MVNTFTTSINRTILILLFTLTYGSLSHFFHYPNATTLSTKSFPKLQQKSLPGTLCQMSIAMANLTNRVNLYCPHPFCGCQKTVARRRSQKRILLLLPLDQGGTGKTCKTSLHSITPAGKQSGHWMGSMGNKWDRTTGW